MAEITVQEWAPGRRGDADVAALAELLYSVVLDGASVSFVLPFSEAEAREFWIGRVLPAVAAGERRMWVAYGEPGRIAGSVQLVLDTPPNQRHRAEIAKLLVHPAARRRGIARLLMQAAEAAAREEGRTLLTLDTRTGDAAEPLYRSMGYVVAGVIPGFARGPRSPELEATTIMYKQLGGRGLRPTHPTRIPNSFLATS